jgi:hypothetical protein
MSRGRGIAWRIADPLSLLTPTVAALCVFSMVLFWPVGPSFGLSFAGAFHWPSPLTLSIFAAGVLLCTAFALAARAQSPFRARAAVLLAAFSGFFIAPQAGLIAERAASAPARSFVNDGIPQVEVAAGFVLHGIDPYGQYYGNTAMGQVRGLDMAVNPAWYHLAYPPLIVIASAALEWVTRGTYDTRALYSCAALLLFGSLLALGRNARESLGFAVLGALFPLFWLDFLSGQNDVVFLSLALGALAALRRRRNLLSGGLMGLSVAAKQTALLLLPVYVVLVLRRGGSAATKAKTLGILALSSAVVIGPFFAWNPHAYWADTVAYLSAGGGHNYPVAGIGFGSFLLRHGFIHSRWDAYPFWAWQILFGAPVVAAGIYLVWRRPVLARVLPAMGATVLTVTYFNRAFHSNYLDVAVVLVELGVWSWVCETRLWDGGHHRMLGSVGEQGLEPWASSL